MSTNLYFPNFSCTREQTLVESLIIEAIRMYGMDIKYIPRNIVNEDELFGDDALSKFDRAATIESYIKSVDGFEGEGDLLSKFNLEIRDQIIFTISRKRFDQIRTSKLFNESGSLITLEEIEHGTSRQFLTGNNETGVIELEDGNNDGFEILNNRPLEGDLIYFPLVKKLFEIKFVEHEAMFYQFGRLQTYDLRCELFSYSSERIETGNTEIDSLGTMFNINILNAFIELEDESGALLAENGGRILLEYRIETSTPTANNELLTKESGNIIDFSEIHLWD